MQFTVFPSTIAWLVDCVIEDGHTPLGSGNTGAKRLHVLGGAGAAPLTLLILGSWTATLLLLICRWPNARGITLITTKSKARQIAFQPICIPIVLLVCLLIFGSSFTLQFRKPFLICM